MKHVSRMSAQGDVLFLRIEELPASAERAEVKGPIIIAHSETGHHHTAESVGVPEFWREPSDPLTCYLVDTMHPVHIVHHRPTDTHETQCLTPGKWMVRRQREHTPEGWRMVQD
jgi:hypothetical protein